MVRSIFDTGGYIGTTAAYPTTKSINPVTSGLVLYLDAGNSASYSGSGSTWTDLSGNGNHFTLFNSPTWSSSNGGRFTFDGSNQYAGLTNGFANFTSGVTIFTIVNMGNATFYERIVDFGSGTPNNNIIFYRIDTLTTLGFYVANGSSATVDYQVSNGIVNNQIACYAVTANGTNVTMYRNGSQIATVAETDLPPNVTRTNCYIGRSNWAGDPYYEGTMSVIMIYNRGLRAEEIAQNYNAFRSRFGI